MTSNSTLPLYSQETLFGTQNALVADVNAHQFKLARIQLFNWGTFSGISDFSIAPDGFLFVGPNGSGKSTVLDAHTTLLTAPRWMGFNTASKESERSKEPDRNYASYIRGAWSQKTESQGEHAVQYLRNGTTWSALAETYVTGTGKTVVLAQMFWIKGNGSASADVSRRFFVLERAFDVRELEVIAQADFDLRKVSHPIDGAFVTDKFSAYQERFQRLLHIESDQALRLLHKTQSAKNLGDLNVFMRDFMLDAPDTFGLAATLVTEFQELRDAHAAVNTAKQQLEMLEPALLQLARYRDLAAEISTTEEILKGLNAFRELTLKGLLEKEHHRLAEILEQTRLKAERLKAAAEDITQEWTELIAKRAGQGGGTIVRLESEIKALEGQLPGITRRHLTATRDFKTLELEFPSNEEELTSSIFRAQEILTAVTTELSGFKASSEKLVIRIDELRKEAARLHLETESLRRHPSNIPSNMLRIRARMAQALGYEENELPFAGELLEVKPSEKAWSGALERVHRGLALSILADESQTKKIARWLETENTGERLVYLRMSPRTLGDLTVHPKSSLNKFVIKDGPYKAWLRDELKAAFNYVCVDSIDELHNYSKALTINGQVKGSSTRYEKDDRSRIDDRSRWVLGFDNTEKLALFEEKGKETLQELDGLLDTQKSLEQTRSDLQEKYKCSQNLANLVWGEIDKSGAETRLNNLAFELEKERKANPGLAELDQSIQEKGQQKDIANNDSATAAASYKTHEENLKKINIRIEELNSELLNYPLLTSHDDFLIGKLAALPRKTTLDNLDSNIRAISEGLRADMQGTAAKQANAQAAVERQFLQFTLKWPADSGGLDAKLASALDFEDKYNAIKKDGLPGFTQRFLTLWHQQSSQKVVMLQSQLDRERKAIADRLEIVNESLAHMAFNEGTHLVIESSNRNHEDIKQFKASLKEILENSLTKVESEEELEDVERRFGKLNPLVQRLNSEETVDRNWRNLVLDVRMHVEFVARELDESGEEIEVYVSSAGKSGGQKQKLAATCLAAALRYQLGGTDRGVPVFSTVALDEAFDKSDGDLTAIAMEVFRSFGFQMLVATPLTKVMTLEPFIGGACFVSIKDRKHSAGLHIEYNREKQTLVLDSALALASSDDYETAA